MNRLAYAFLIVVTLMPAVSWAQELPAGGDLYLHRLFRMYDRWHGEQFPEDAMRRGDYAFADRVTDQSLQAIERRHEKRLDFLEQLRSIDPELLNDVDRDSYELFELILRDEIDGHRFRTFLAPLGARFGLHQQIPQMGEHVRFESIADFRKYLARLEQMPAQLRHVQERMRQGIAEGRVPPRVAMIGVPEQIEVLAGDVERGGLKRLFAPFRTASDRLEPEALQAIESRLERAVLPPLRDALAELGRFVREQYLPACRESIAATDWPEGDDYYAHQLRSLTTTDLGPREIHELGLAEVARIRGEMLEVIRATDFVTEDRGRSGDRRDLDDDELFARFIEHLRTDSRFYYDDPGALLDGYRAICKRIDGHMPRFFGLLPRLPYGVKAVPDFMAPRQTTAYYVPGDLRNAEPGWFYANTYALEQRPRYEMVALAMHEAVPGHHHQISIAKELGQLPEFRRNAYFVAFGEGWALYAERLGLEMGLYDDPYDDFGRLLYEMWRACRLVVDPGVHALGWSREEAIDFMTRHTALSELNIVNEVDRYIAWPGQATAYKIGELRIRELREKAERTLGSRFDLRGFHDAVLGAGTVPLSVLDRRIEHWIRTKQLGPLGYD